MCWSGNMLLMLKIKSVLWFFNMTEMLQSGRTKLRIGQTKYKLRVLLHKKRVESMCTAHFAVLYLGLKNFSAALVMRYG